KKGATPAAIRLELIKTSYRANANFTMQGLEDSQRQIDRWKRLESWLTAHASHAIDGPGPLRRGLDVFTQSLCADLNVQGAIAALNEAASQHDIQHDPPASTGSTTYADELDALHAMNSVLGVLDLETEARVQGDDVAMIDAKVAARTAAKASKDWATADRIRDELLELGIAIKDGPEGTTWSRSISS
ncbi:MAG: hypothetical protein KC983_03540, partial [Phycisphaerales bacterium]|nr:hypothetical protein [Phycisphaerales bacterium]